MAAVRPQAPLPALSDGRRPHPSNGHHAINLANYCVWVQRCEASFHQAWSVVMTNVEQVIFKFPLVTATFL